jgi:hypothetical protein
MIATARVLSRYYLTIPGMMALLSPHTVRYMAFYQTFSTQHICSVAKICVFGAFFW